MPTFWVIFMADFETGDIEREFELFLNTFDSEDPEERRKASKIINYIIRQLNNESLKGDLQWDQYKTLVLKGIKGLFKLIYIDYFDYSPINRMHKLIRADIIFASSSNFLLMLFTRVYEGRDRDLICRQIEAQRPISLSRQ